jgi:hypothetical protein
MPPARRRELSLPDAWSPSAEIAMVFREGDDGPGFFALFFDRLGLDHRGSLA